MGSARTLTVEAATPTEELITANIFSVIPRTIGPSSIKSA
jgi:hypothetical protein